MSQEATQSAKEEVIVCHVTRWYFRRMGLMSLMLVGMGLYFFYDGMYGYPKKNEIAKNKEWFEREVVGTGETPHPGSYEDAKRQGADMLTRWIEDARTKRWIVSERLNEPRWDDYAFPHGWSSEPKLYSEEEIEQQFWWGGTVLFGGLVTAVVTLLNRKKTFTGLADHMIMPNGQKVLFHSVYKIDKRKWDNKGLAYAYYRETDTAPSRKAVIDDLKFAGADKILSRLQDNFSGELIEKVAEADDSEEENSESKS